MPATLPNHPSKAQELEHLAAFIAALPRDSYLASMFPAEVQAEAQRMISADLVPDSLADIWRIRAREQAAAAEELAAGARQLETLRGQIRQLERERARLAASLEDLRSEARTLARLAIA